MALSNAAVAAKLDKLIASQALILAAIAALQPTVAAGAPVAPAVASPVVAAPVAVARPLFAASGATLTALAAAGDVDAIAEQAFRAAKRAAK